MKNNEQLRYFDQKLFFVQKYRCFYLKVALFVEKRKNKFAYELKKNKFVFNYKIDLTLKFFTL
jgi:hypothetical protein